MKIHHDVEFEKLRKKLKHVKGNEDKIKLLEELVKLQPRNPRHLTFRKQYKKELETLKVKVSHKRTSTHSSYEHIHYKREVAIIGRTNTGRSTLLSRLTGSAVQIAETSFTTYHPEIGMLECKDVAVQVVEIPPIYMGDYDTAKFKFLRNMDVLCLCSKTGEDFKIVADQLEEHLIIMSDSEECIAKDHKQRPKDEIIEKPTIIAGWEKGLSFNDINPVDVNDIEAITDRIYHLLNIQRIYCLKHGKIDGKPVVFHRNEEVAITHFIEHLDRRLSKAYHRAKIYGESSMYDGQIVGLDHVLSDGDRVELIK